MRCRYDVVVTGQHHGCSTRHEFGGVGNQALKPGQLVIEFRSRLRIPIREVDGSDQDSLNRRFNVASLPIFRIMPFRISRQACAGLHANLVSRENGPAVPGALALPDCFVPESPKGLHGKGSLLCLELLQTHHVRLSFRQPSQQVVEPLIDVVNVEGGDFHRVTFCPRLAHPLAVSTSEAAPPLSRFVRQGGGVGLPILGTEAPKTWWSRIDRSANEVTMPL